MKYLEPFLNALLENLHDDKVPSRIDVVLEGGALNGAYEAGVMCYIRELERRKKTQVVRISGVSCGALIAVLYLTSKIDKIDELYSKLTENLLDSGTFDKLHEIIHGVLGDVSDEDAKSLTGRLFVTYMDLTSQSRQVVSEYNTKNDLIEVLKKSSYLPGFIDGELLTADQCMDGGTPYVFPFDIEKRKDNNYKTLYVKLSSLNLLREALSTKSDLNVARRAVEGIQRTHDLLKDKQSNQLVSFVEDWTFKDYSINSVGRLVWLLMTIIVRITVVLLAYIPSDVKQSGIYRRLTSLFKEMWIDFGHRVLN